MGPRDRVDEIVADAPGGWRPIASLAAGAVLWQVVSTVGGRSAVPPLSDVLATLMTMAREGGLTDALAASAVGLVAGFGLAAVIGVTVGALLGRVTALDRMTDIYLDAVMSAPTLVYVPVLFAAFGVSRVSQVAVVFLYAVFVIVETTAAGVRAVDRKLLDMARAFGATERQAFTRVALPAAAPFVVTGVSLGLTRAVKGMVVGEMVIALSGLGAMLRARGARFDLEGVLALLLVVVFVSVACNAVISAAGRRLLARTGGR